MNIKHKIEKLITQCRNGTIQERCSAIADLQEMHAEEAVPVILELLDFHDAGVRANVACALGELGNEDVGPALLTLLRDPDSLVRINAAESLGILKYSESLHSLIHTLQTDRDPLVRVHAAEALGRLKNISALPALTKALDDSDEGVRAYAADSIGSLEHVKALRILTEKLDFERSTFVKAYLASALYRLGNREALVSMIDLAKSSNDTLAVTIINLASEITTSRDAASLITHINEIVQSRPTLRQEVDSLKKRLHSLQEVSESSLDNSRE